MEKRLVSWQWEHQYSRTEQVIVFKQTIATVLLLLFNGKTNTETKIFSKLVLLSVVMHCFAINYSLLNYEQTANRANHPSFDYLTRCTFKKLHIILKQKTFSTFICLFAF